MIKSAYQSRDERTLRLVFLILILFVIPFFFSLPPHSSNRLSLPQILRHSRSHIQKLQELSFILAGQKTEEVGGLLDREGIAVRSGHHCAQPILRRFGVEATVRASLAPYNTCEDIDALVAALHRLQAGRGTLK